MYEMKCAKILQRTIMDLPPEILQIIFSFCSVSDLLESVQYVCQKWQESVFTPAVWRTKILEISRNENSEELKALLHQMPFLKSVWLHHPSCKTLEVLCDYCPLLNYLCINCSDPKVCLGLISKLASLTHIDLCFQRSFKLEVAFHDCDYSFPPLLHTVIFRMCTTDGSIPLSLLKTCNFLEHLVVSLKYDLESFIKPSLERKAQNIRRTPGRHNLQTIYLCGAVLCGKHILCAISQFPNLKYLALKHNLFHDEDIQKTILKEPRPELIFLDLSYSFNLTTDAVVSVAKSCPNLVYLSLMRCFIDDGALLVVIEHLHQVQCLNLHGTEITSQHFCKIPGKLPNLKDINLCACRRIEPQTLTALINVMPNLIIVNPRKGLLKGAYATERHHIFLEQRNAMDF